MVRRPSLNPGQSSISVRGLPVRMIEDFWHISRRRRQEKCGAGGVSAAAPLPYYQSNMFRKLTLLALASSVLAQGPIVEFDGIERDWPQIFATSSSGATIIYGGTSTAMAVGAFVPGHPGRCVVVVRGGLGALVRGQGGGCYGAGRRGWC